MDACKIGIALEITRLARRMCLTPNSEDDVKVYNSYLQVAHLSIPVKSITP